jgi:HD-like signal output (HDOD) protein
LSLPGKHARGESPVAQFNELLKTMSVQAPVKFDIQRILAKAQLPALPQSAIRLLELSQNPENGAAEIGAPIEADPGLAGQVLRFVNSSYFGFSREISSVKYAITLVGVRTIKNFALWSAVFSLMPNPKCGPFDLKHMSQDSLRRALFARAMAKTFGVQEAEETFSAALLQDLAVPLLAKEMPEIYIKLLGARDSGRLRLSELEQRVFGWTHAEVGGIVARQWSLPEDFAVLIENHLQLDDPPSASSDRRLMAVAMSSLLPTVADPIWTECGRLEAYYETVRPAQAPSFPDFLGKLDCEYAEFAPVVKIALPPKSLVESHAEVRAAGAA